MPRRTESKSEVFLLSRFLVVGRSYRNTWEKEEMTLQSQEVGLKLQTLKFLRLGISLFTLQVLGKNCPFFKKKKKKYIYIYIYITGVIFMFSFSFLAILHGKQDASSLTRD